MPVFFVSLHGNLILDLCFKDGTVSVFLHAHVIFNRNGTALINAYLDAWHYFIKDSIDKLTSHRYTGILVTDLILNLETFFLQSVYE